MQKIINDNSINNNISNHICLRFFFGNDNIDNGNCNNNCDASNSVNDNHDNNTDKNDKTMAAIPIVIMKELNTK